MGIRVEINSHDKISYIKHTHGNKLVKFCSFMEKRKLSFITKASRILWPLIAEANLTCVKVRIVSIISYSYIFLFYCYLFSLYIVISFGHGTASVSSVGVETFKMLFVTYNNMVSHQL